MTEGLGDWETRGLGECDSRSVIPSGMTNIVARGGAQRNPGFGNHNVKTVRGKMAKNEMET